MTTVKHVHRWTGPWIDHRNGRQYMWCSKCEVAEYGPREVQKIQQLNTMQKSQGKDKA